jgi:hypothetical protein
MGSDKSEGKIGAGHASAWLRQGLSELRAALYPDSNVAQLPQYGLYGTRTPGEVAEARRAEEPNRDEERSANHPDLDSRLEVEPGHDHREPPELERE